MNFKQNARESFNKLLSIIIDFVIVVLLIVLASLICHGFLSYSKNKIEEYIPSNSQWYGGYYPGMIYEIYDKNTGVYYGITDTGFAFPLYTINGELRLVDQGNEYVVHRNLGEPSTED